MQLDPLSRISKVHGKSPTTEKCSVLLAFHTSLPARGVQLGLSAHMSRYSLRTSRQQSCAYKKNDQRYSPRHFIYRVPLRATKLAATNTSTNVGLNAPARCPLYAAVFLLCVSVKKHERRGLRSSQFAARKTGAPCPKTSPWLASPQKLSTAWE